MTVPSQPIPSTITQLPVASQVFPTDIGLIVQNGVTKQAEISLYLVGISASGLVTSITAGTGLSGNTTTGNVTLSLDVPVTIAHGGTNATTSGAARTQLGAASSAITLIAGSGLTGGGSLSGGNITFALSGGATGTVTQVNPGVGMSFTAITNTGSIDINLTVVATVSNAIVLASKTLSGAVYTGTLGGAASSVIALDAGTITVPALTFSGDTDTGFFRSAANTIDVTTSGVRAAQFSPTNAAINYPVFTGSVTGVGVSILPAGGDTNIDLILGGKGTGVAKGVRENLEVIMSDMSTAITTGSSKGGLIVPYNMQGAELFISLLAAQSTSGVVTVLAAVNGASMLSTAPVIGANLWNNLSGTGSVAAVLSTSSLSKGDRIMYDISTAGTGAKALLAVLTGKQT